MNREALCVCTAAVAICAMVFLRNYKTVPDDSPSDTKRCAAANVVILAHKECMMFFQANGSCVVTMGDYEREINAEAEAQNYCPVLGPGEEGGNQ